uniref:Uncharacterized protein n=1 Tax=Hyaloperonospora arabidopsidis (strain Emoy2) TaxID=559515 RepID=M4BTR4_HYAAE
MWLVEDSIKGLLILSGTARERRSVGRILWLIGPGWLSSPRNYSRTKLQCYLNSTRSTFGHQSGDQPPVSGHGGGDRQGLGTNLVDSGLHLLRHQMGTAEPLGAQSRGNNRRPTNANYDKHCFDSYKL